MRESVGGRVRVSVRMRVRIKDESHVRCEDGLVHSFVLLLCAEFPTTSFNVTVVYVT